MARLFPDRVHRARGPLGIGVAVLGGVSGGFAVMSAIPLIAGSLAVGRQIDQKRRGEPTIYEQQRQ